MTQLFLKKCIKKRKSRGIWKRYQISRFPHQYGISAWWEVRDSNPGSLPTTDLQSAPFGRSGNLPYWSWREESNLQPADYKSAALPLSHASIFKWCSRADSNRRHMDFQSNALPAELPEQNQSGGTSRTRTLDRPVMSRML